MYENTLSLSGKAMMLFEIDNPAIVLETVKMVKYIIIFAHTHICTYTRMHAPTLSHTHTHTHTHTHVIILNFSNDITFS